LAAGPATAVENPAPPKLRLPGGAAPVGYRVALSIDPGEPTFTGSVDVDVRLSAASDVLWLNATELEFEKVSASSGGSPVGVRLIEGDPDFVGFAFERPVPVGELLLHAEYRGRIAETSTQGVFRQKDGDAWYVYTQLESTDARRAFPCFDEPGIKTPWELTLTIPAGTSAVSNTPIASETAAPSGGRVVRLARTEPL